MTTFRQAPWPDEVPPLVYTDEVVHAIYTLLAICLPTWIPLRTFSASNSDSRV